VPNLPRASLLVVEREDGPVYYAKWRHDGRQVKRRIGPAWIVRDLPSVVSLRGEVAV